VIAITNLGPTSIAIAWCIQMRRFDAVKSDDCFNVQISTVVIACDSMLSALCCRPYVRVSVRLSHGWISQKQLKLGLWRFHNTTAPSL